MNLFKFITYYNKVRCLFMYLPKGLQEDLVDDMKDAYMLCLLSKYQKKMKGEI